MDRLDSITLSKIATIINNQSLIKTTSNSTWERILLNAGQEELYNTFRGRLSPYTYHIGYQNPNDSFDEFFNAIHSILRAVYSNGDNTEDFVLLMNSLVEEIELIDLFDSEKDARNVFKKIERYRTEHTDEECLELILNKAKSDFLKLRSNLNVLNLDVAYKNSRLTLKPFTNQSIVQRNPSLLLDWLNEEYESIGEIYEEALENFTSGEAVSCISNCRNIITGIFSEFKDDGTVSWVVGLKNLSTDRNIENIVSPKHIVQGSANKQLQFQNDKQFKYPRFKMIYSLYTLTSDLGSHSTEAPMIDGELCPEITTLDDALLCLRLTEDVLIWTKNRIKGL